MSFRALRAQSSGPQVSLGIPSHNCTPSGLSKKILKGEFLAFADIGNIIYLCNFTVNFNPTELKILLWALCEPLNFYLRSLESLFGFLKI